VRVGHDDRAACRFLVELDRGGKHVDGERRCDPEVCVATVDSEPAEQQRGDGIGRASGERLWRCRAVDAADRDGRIPDDNGLGVCDHPGRGGIAPPVLTGVAARPLVEPWLAAVGPFAVMSPRVEQRRPPQLSQAS
jgi:hypothetical protein